MARRVPAGRTLVVFLLALGLCYGLVAVLGTWQPRMGLDLDGGTRITLVAQDDPTADELEETRRIVERRVEDWGVRDGEVAVQGDRDVVVEVPGVGWDDEVATLERQAQMRLRLVADSAPGVASGSSTESPSPDASPDPAPADVPDDVDPYAWADAPGEDWRALFEAHSCGAGSDAQVRDDARQPLVTCGQGGRKYLLSPAVVDGDDLDSASPRAPGQQTREWAVTLDFDRSGTEDFADMSRALAGGQEQFAVVLDGQVVSALTMTNVITNGQAEIGGFDEAAAESLATSLDHGALPVSFEAEPTVETVGPSLGGDQLRAGLAAGALGLVLVILWLLAFYRGLGLVVVGSLLAAAVLAYPLVVLLGEGIGLTLTLPAVAGLVLGALVTADCCVVLVERIRDELRDGMSLQVAVERSWARSRNTCLAAGAVSLVAALVLYVFATGAVQGFALALGLATLVALVVFFAFTRPLIGLLAEKAYFRAGHRWSGLSRESLGVA